MLDQREALHGCTHSFSQKSIHATIQVTTDTAKWSFYHLWWQKEAASTSISRRQDQMKMKFGWWCSPSVCEHSRFETSKQLQKCLEGFGWTLCVSVNLVAKRHLKHLQTLCIRLIRYSIWSRSIDTFSSYPYCIWLLMSWCGLMFPSRQAAQTQEVHLVAECLAAGDDVNMQALFRDTDRLA